MADWRSTHPLSPAPANCASPPGAVAPVTTEWATTTTTAGPLGYQAGVAAHCEVAVFEDGPHIMWWGVDPDELRVMAMALLDAARAVRNGDDPGEVARQEWLRRGGRPELD